MGFVNKKTTDQLFESKLLIDAEQKIMLLNFPILNTFREKTTVFLKISILTFMFLKICGRICFAVWYMAPSYIIEAQQKPFGGI